MGNDSMYTGSQLGTISYSDSLWDSVVETKKVFGQTDSNWIDMLFDGQDKVKHSGLNMNINMKKRKSMELSTHTSTPELSTRANSCNDIPQQQPKSVASTSTTKRRRGRPRKYNIQEDESYNPISMSVEIPEPELFEYSPYTLDQNQTTLDDLNLVLDLLRGDDEVEEHVIDDILSTKDEVEHSSKEIITKADDFDFAEENKSRSKWTEAELLRLWQGIAKHGNNWTAIRGTCLGRSYCQIKDKGRRCLFLLGWETGRSKIETDSSSIHAKKIANAVLAELE